MNKSDPFDKELYVAHLFFFFPKLEPIGMTLTNHHNSLLVLYCTLPKTQSGRVFSFLLCQVLNSLRD